MFLGYFVQGSKDFMLSSEFSFIILSKDYEKKGKIYEQTIFYRLFWGLSHFACI